MNIVELEEALFPGGKSTEDLSKTVEKLKAVHGADHIADLLRELQQLLGTQYLGALRQAGVVSAIMPLTDEHKRRAAEAMERQNEPPKHDPEP